MTDHIFISYARADGAQFAADLRDHLEAEGFPVWLDTSSERGIGPGTSWLESIKQAIADCWTFIFVITPGSVISEVCGIELDTAIQHGKPIVPLRWVPVPAHAVPDLIKATQYIDFAGDDHTAPRARLRQTLKALRGGDAVVPGGAPVPRIVGAPPPVPDPFVGRDTALDELRGLLAVGEDADAGPVVVMHAYPGMGKTTAAAALARAVQDVFPDGVFWTDLGPDPDLIQEFCIWGKALGNEGICHHTKEETVQAGDMLRDMLEGKQALLIVDDVWAVEHGEAFIRFRAGCPMLITTRFPQYGSQFTTPAYVYRLPQLDPDAGLEIFRGLAPQVAAEHEAACRQLVDDLEGLPLALVVAARLLQDEQDFGLSVKGLIEEISEGAAWLEAKAPKDRTEFDQETSHLPTVGALLKRSVETLSAEHQRYFALLGDFEAKPARFDLEAIRWRWDVDDPGPIIRVLGGRGLLERAPDVPGETGPRFQMHATLHVLAKSMYNDLKQGADASSLDDLDLDFGDDDDF